jgi:hypothetical protein
MVDRHQDRVFNSCKPLGTMQVNTRTKYSPSSEVLSQNPQNKMAIGALFLTRKEKPRECLSYRGAITNGTGNVVIILRLIFHLRFLATFLSADASGPRRRTLLPWVGSRTDTLPSLVIVP